MFFKSLIPEHLFLLDIFQCAKFGFSLVQKGHLKIEGNLLIISFIFTILHRIEQQITIGRVSAVR